METKKSIKTFFIRTYGCQMNELDSELMAGILERRGLLSVDEEERADLLIFNTCSIRDLAERKVMGKIGALKRKKGSKPLIGITGCMAVAKKESLFKKLPHIDFVLGTNNIADLDAVLDEILDGAHHSIRASGLFHENLNYLIAKREDPLKAFVSIIRGCDKHCTYCVVPSTRGHEVSRPAKSIVEECKHLVDQGYKEITLLGQNVNSYGKESPQSGILFHDLLAQLNAIAGLKRIRFMTSHPVDITEELMQAVRDLPSVCEFVHFPLQAGSNRILRKMHRIYTKEEYIEKVARFREIAPKVRLGTDIIVGFPTETDAEFEETYALFKEIGYSVAFLFAYSRRKDTPAFRWKDDIPEEVKQERLQRLLALHDEITKKELLTFVGTDVEVLVESKGKGERMLKGRTRCWKKVLFQGPESLIGTLQSIRVDQALHQTLLAHLGDHKAT